MIDLKLGQSKVYGGLSPILYHATTTDKALSILKVNSFELMPVIRDAEKALSPNALYYFSTSRGKWGGYTSNTLYSAGVVFVLDGRKLSHNYTGKAVDYWGRSWRDGMRETKEYDREKILDKYEAEDRVLTSKPSIKPASKYIKEIHVLVYRETDKKYKSAYAKELRYLAGAAKKQNIPIYFYNDRNHIKTQNKAKAIKLFDLIDKKTHKPDKDAYERDASRDAIRAKEEYHPYLELYYAKRFKDLKSKEAKDMAPRLDSDFWIRDYSQSLSINSLGNLSRANEYQKKEAHKFLKLMKKHKTNTVEEFFKKVFKPKLLDSNFWK